MTTEHPITPTPELVERLRAEAPHGIRDAGVTREFHLINVAYAAGADQELEACCGWLTTTAMSKPWETVAQLANQLRIARRPKPPSLKEQAKQAWLRFMDQCGHDSAEQEADDYDTIRRALEALPD